MRDKNAEILLETMPVVVAHDTLMSVLFQNLILNSIKYNESETPKVYIGFEESETDIVFSIRDNGIGIPLQYQEEIFRMFRRLHTSDKYEGSGIGLAFCKRIIDFYGGNISFKSEEGEGTTFYCSFPIKMLHEVEHETDENPKVDALPDNQVEKLFLK